jgi:hypothetical protein
LQAKLTDNTAERRKEPCMSGSKGEQDNEMSKASQDSHDTTSEHQHIHSDNVDEEGLSNDGFDRQESLQLQRSSPRSRIGRNPQK